jgi:hypothetical protein
MCTSSQASVSPRRLHWRYSGFLIYRDYEWYIYIFPVLQCPVREDGLGPDVEDEFLVYYCVQLPFLVVDEFR